MSALRKAFEQAGYRPAAERLQEAAKDAVAAHPRDFAAAEQVLFAAIRPHADLLWELFAPLASQAARELLRPLATLAKTEAGGGHSGFDNLGRRAPPKRPRGRRCAPPGWRPPAPRRPSRS